MPGSPRPVYDKTNSLCEISRLGSFVLHHRDELCARQGQGQPQIAELRVDQLGTRYLLPLFSPPPLSGKAIRLVSGRAHPFSVWASPCMLCNNYPGSISYTLPYIKRAQPSQVLLKITQNDPS